MSYDLDRFRRAQDAASSGYDVALSELRAGQKESHWIWYVFPQLRGLGQSYAATLFGLDGVGEARAYLADATLRERLVRATEAVHAHVAAGADLEHLMGAPIDALKLVSSLTLFEAVAREGAAPDAARLATLATAVLDAAAARGYPRCAFTLARVRA